MLKSRATPPLAEESSGVRGATAARSASRSRAKRVTQAERTQEARERIIAAAFACLAEKGYQHTTLVEIAKRAGCSRELPRYHFGTKDSLMEVLVDEIQAYWKEKFDQQRTSNATALEMLWQTADWIVQEIKENATTVRGFMILVFCVTDPTNNALHKKIFITQKRTRNNFKAIILRHIDEHPELEWLDANATAALIYGIFRGLSYHWLIDPTGVSVDAMFGEFKRICPSLLSGTSATVSR